MFSKRDGRGKWKTKFFMGMLTAFNSVRYRFLLYGKFRERARWSDTARFVPAITFRRSPSGCTKVPIRKYFSVTVLRFSVISLSGWNWKTRKQKRVITFAYNWLPFQRSKINKYEDHFFSALYAM